MIPQTESVLCRELGKATAAHIYTDDHGLLTRTLVKAAAEAGRNFVELEDVIIRSIQLPETVRAAIEQKLVQQQILKSYRFCLQIAEREAERLRIEGGGIRDYQQIVGETLTERLLTYQGIMATHDIAESKNPKTVVIGAGDVGVPLLLDGGDATRALSRSTTPAPAR